MTGHAFLSTYKELCDKMVSKYCIRSINTLGLDTNDFRSEVYLKILVGTYKPELRTPAGYVKLILSNVYSTYTNKEMRHYSRHSYSDAYEDVSNMADYQEQDVWGPAQPSLLPTINKTLDRIPEEYQDICCYILEGSSARELVRDGMYKRTDVDAAMKHLRAALEDE